MNTPIFRRGGAAFRRAVVLLALVTAAVLIAVGSRPPVTQPPGDPRTAAEHLQLAEHAMSQAEFAAAASEARRALALDPELTRAYRLLGHASYKLQRYEEARAALEQALARNPEDAFVACFLGLSYAQQPRDAAEQERARELLERSLLGYRGAEPYYGLGLLALRDQQIEAAVTYFRQAVKTDPGWESGHYRLAEALRIAGREQEAAAEARIFERLKRSRPEYERLFGEVARNPQDSAALRRLARLCLGTHRYREALDHFRALAGRSPDAETFAGMARAADALGEAQLAAEVREAARAAHQP